MNNRQEQEYQFYRCFTEVKSRLDDWQYEQILKKYIPELVTVAGEDALKMVGYLLCDAINFSSRETKEKQDNLPIWEDEDYRWQDGILKIFKIAVRDAAEQIVKNGPNKIREIVLLLERWRWRVFHRIALHLIRKFPDAEPQLIAEELANPKYFDNSSYQDYEYISLAKEHFANLPLETRQTILSQIENFNFDWHWEEDPEKKDKYLRRWQLRRLTPLKDSLPENWQKRYEQLVEEFGAVELSDLFSRGVDKVRVGLVPPKTVSDLASMSNEELISFLKSWQPTNRDYFEPSPEGLGMELGKVAEQDPERFILIAEHFQGLHPRYGCGLLRGLRNAINNKKGKAEEPTAKGFVSVLLLCLFCC